MERERFLRHSGMDVHTCLADAIGDLLPFGVFLAIPEVITDWGLFSYHQILFSTRNLHSRMHQVPSATFLPAWSKVPQGDQETVLYPQRKHQRAQGGENCCTLLPAAAGGMPQGLVGFRH